MKKDYLIVADILKNRRLEEGLTLRELEKYLVLFFLNFTIEFNDECKFINR